MTDDAKAAVKRVESLCAEWERQPGLSIRQSQMIIAIKNAIAGDENED